MLREGEKPGFRDPRKGWMKLSCVELKGYDLKNSTTGKQHAWTQCSTQEFIVRIIHTTERAQILDVLLMKKEPKANILK